MLLKILSGIEMAIWDTNSLSLFRKIPWNNSFWPTVVVGEADSVNSVSASYTGYTGRNSVRGSLLELG